MTKSVVSIQAVNKFVKPNFWNKPIQLLRDISFEINDQDLFGFIGSNGAGKTTFIKCMIGLLNFSGSIQFLSGHSYENIRSQVGFMPENTYFYEYLTAKEQLKLFARFYDIESKLIPDRIDEVLSTVGLDTLAPNKKISQFSKGMKQRLSMAQAIINRPQLLILDEPMSGLDPVGRKGMRDIICAERDRGCTIFFSTHILSDLESICNRIAIIKSGSILQDIRVKEVLEQANQLGCTFEDMVVKNFLAFE